MAPTAHRLVPFAVVALLPLPIHAASTEDPSPAAGAPAWVLRFGAGAVTLVLDGLKHGASEGDPVGLALAVEARKVSSPMFSWGVGVDVERIGWSGHASGERSQDEGVVEPGKLLDDEWLALGRAQAVFRWDLLAAGTVTPFVACGVGLGVRHASTHRTRCTPQDPVSPVISMSGGLDWSLTEAWTLGIDFRLATPTFPPLGCDDVYIVGEPPEPPLGLSLRSVLALSRPFSW